jgi:hypothetical protein
MTRFESRPVEAREPSPWRALGLNTFMKDISAPRRLAPHVVIRDGKIISTIPFRYRLLTMIATLLRVRIQIDGDNYGRMSLAQRQYHGLI